MAELPAHARATVQRILLSNKYLPFPERPLLFPWWRNNWAGKCTYHVRPRPERVWSPVSWDEGDYCREVLARDPCSYCGGPVEVIDHIHPSARGGANDTTNLTGACRACNASKSAKSLLTFLLTRADPSERINDRLQLAKQGYDLACSASIVEIGTTAWHRGFADARRSLAAARREADHRDRWAA